MSVDITYISFAGLNSIIILLIALLVRLIGVYISLLGTNFNNKEKLFVMISYIPKATVQAAIGGIPLSMGLESGQIILTMAVISILITAPIGAILIDYTYDKLLER